MKSQMQKTLLTGVALSEASHIFCCVFPTLFSLMGLLAGLGVSVAMPAFMIQLHEVMHGWEVPMIIFSGVVLVLGWAIVLYSEKVDCHDTGCGHGACAPAKRRAHLVLKIATVLFLLNITVYWGIHSRQALPSADAHSHAAHGEAPHIH